MKQEDKPMPKYINSYQDTFGTGYELSVVLTTYSKCPQFQSEDGNSLALYLKKEHCSL